MSRAKKKAPAEAKSARETVVEASPVQVVSRGMSYWLLLVAVGLAALFAAALYFGLFVVASTFGSILLVSITLYVFFRYWPEDEPLKPAPARPTLAPKPRRAMVQMVEVDGPPKARFMMALRDASRRQGNFKISQQGAERFARTIRYLLRNG